MYNGFEIKLDEQGIKFQPIIMGDEDKYAGYRLETHDGRVLEMAAEVLVGKLLEFIKDNI